jgi:hypothetical protein
MRTAAYPGFNSVSERIRPVPGREILQVSSEEMLMRAAPNLVAGRLVSTTAVNADGVARVGA